MIVNVYLFKPSGKWNTTLELDMAPWYKAPVLFRACKEVIENNTHYRVIPPAMCIPDKDYIYAVIINPFHMNAHPQLLFLEND